ncbi:MAG TPA: DUF4124 domain-containing protein [Candidatus Deferrimicrobiaceae bacterium]
MPKTVRHGHIGIAGFAAVAVLFAGCPAFADIYKWVDDQGTMHFTDDPVSIPASKRDQSVPLIKEPPKDADNVAPETPPPATVQATPEPIPTDAGETRDEALAREIEQLKAKIAAKEALIKAVDDKRSQFPNPMRNRIVNTADMDLYKKYTVELPGDREHLQQLETQLQGSR